MSDSKTPEAGATRGAHWVTEADAEVEITMGEAQAGETPMTVMGLFAECVEKNGDLPALTACDTFKNDELRTSAALKQWTWKQYQADVRQCGKAFMKLGLQRFQSVNIIGFNSPEWVIADVGCIAAGGIAAGMYTTNGPEACHYVAEHSDATTVVCQGKGQLDKMIEVADRLPALTSLVAYDYIPTDADKAKCKATLYGWEEFMALGDQVEDSAIDARIAEQKPGHCCTLIYTSGTTGPPKAVMISHDNVTWTSKRTLDWLSFSPGDTVVSYLPLSHIAAQMLDIHSAFHIGSHVNFADPMALKGSLGDTLRRVQPAIFFGVPRVWEKIGDKIKAIGATVTGLKKKISTWCKGKGKEMAMYQQFGHLGWGEVNAKNVENGTTCSKPSCYGCANTLVFKKIKATLGLTNCKGCFTGAAPIGKDTLELFASLGIPVLELFGQSECTGPATTNTPEMWKLGSVGVPLNGTEMVIAEETKEIVYRGRHIFMGYLKMPEKTAETIDADGWLHSGDQGKLEDNFLSITGRIKELIITAGGENIPPVLIEDQIKAATGALSNVMVIGDKRKYLSAVYTLRQKMTGEGSPDPSGELDVPAAEMAKIGSEAKTVAEARECPKFKAYLDAALEVANGLATSKAQRIQKYVILDEDFSVPGGELGPTLKLMRSKAYTKWQKDIDGLYGGESV